MIIVLTTVMLFASLMVLAKAAHAGSLLGMLLGAGVTVLSAWLAIGGRRW